MLADCVASVEAQSCPDWEQVIVRDEVGIGIGGMFGEIERHTDELHGEYVYVLQDDDVIVDSEFVGGLKRFADEQGMPDVVIVRSRKGPLDLPMVWEAAPAMGMIDLANYVVRRDVFVRFAGCFGQRYAGDFDFIDAVWRSGARFAWCTRYASMAQQIGRGRSE